MIFQFSLMFDLQGFYYNLVLLKYILIILKFNLIIFKEQVNHFISIA